jgi:hypothetical protein
MASEPSLVSEAPVAKDSIVEGLVKLAQKMADTKPRLAAGYATAAAGIAEKMLDVPGALPKPAVAVALATAARSAAEAGSAAAPGLIKTAACCAAATAQARGQKSEVEPPKQEDIELPAPAAGKEAMVEGLADAAKAMANSKPMAAAGLASAAAGLARESVDTEGPRIGQPDPAVATGLAKAANAAAEVGASSAPGLIKATASSAVACVKPGSEPVFSVLNGMN